jgi:dTDP-4-dehydrorhamnose 3,5-epimerase-like enzyme
MRLDLLVETTKIAGVEFEVVKTFGDNRGYFREAARIDKPFFNEKIESMYQMIIPAHTQTKFSYQAERVEWLYVPIGTLEVILRDLRPTSPSAERRMSFSLGENQTYMHAKIPAGVACSFKTGDQPAYLFFISAISDKGSGKLERVML